MSVEPTSAVQKFIASARELHAEENDPVDSHLKCNRSRQKTSAGVL